MGVSASVSLAALNTLRLPATADWFAPIGNVEELQAVLSFARNRGLAVLPLGEGSNVVLSDHIPGLVLHMVNRGIQLRRDDGERVCLRVPAGENWHDLVVWCCDQGLHGLENLALIPGSVGAAPVQNIGAYGVELSERVQGVEVVNTGSGKADYLSAADCCFGYRTSLFKHAEGTDLLITAVDLVLDRRAPVHAEYPSLQAALGDMIPTHRQVMEAVMAVRRRRLPDPVIAPNVGSFFKNPVVGFDVAAALLAQHPNLPNYPAEACRVKLSAAWMIDQLGWRGKEQGGVAVSDAHSLVLVNRTATTSRAVLALAQAIYDSVLEHFGVALSMEPTILGPDGSHPQ